MMDWNNQTVEQTPLAKQKLLTIEPEKINYASFYRDGQFIECLNEHGQWNISKPVAARADDAKINLILAALEMLPREETITLAQRQARKLTLEDYGLSKPRARMVLGDANKRHWLAIGNESPLKNAVYVQLDHEDEVIATATNLMDILPQHVADIRDPHLLQGSALYVRRLEIRRADGPLIQLIKETNEWIIHKPIMARANWTKVSSLLEQLFAMTMRRFVTETMADPVAYGLNDDEALLQINLELEGEQNPDRLIFSKKADEHGDQLYAGRRGSSLVFTVSREQLEALLAATLDLRDQRLYFMAPEKMAMIRLEQGERSLEFHKDAERTWRIVEPKQWLADSRMLADLISRLNTFRADKTFISTNMVEMGLDRPALIIRVSEELPISETITSGARQLPTRPGEKQKRTLLLSAFKPGREYVFARFEDTPEIYQISASSSSTISFDPLSYRDNTILALNPAAIHRISLKKGVQEQIVERSAAGIWTSLAPIASQVSLVQISNLLAQVVDLKVLRFERSDIKDPAVYGLKDARASVTFSLDGEDGIQKTLLLGDDSEDMGIYAMFQGQDTIFVLEKTLANDLMKELTR